jgi:uncharacterized membrane protein
MNNIGFLLVIFAFSSLDDVIDVFTLQNFDSKNADMLRRAALWQTASGCVALFVAAIFGFVEWKGTVDTSGMTDAHWNTFWAMILSNVLAVSGGILFIYFDQTTSLGHEVSPLG